MKYPELTKQITVEPAKFGWIAYGECCGIPFVAEGDSLHEARTEATLLAAQMYVRRRK